MRDTAGQGHPSIRRRLLVALLLPMLLLLIVDAVITYRVALSYSNRIHDEDLADDVRTLARALRAGGDLQSALVRARTFIGSDLEGHAFYSVRSSQHGLLGGRDMSDRQTPPLPGAAPEIFDSRLDGERLRAATLSVVSPQNSADILAVTIAETLGDRQRRARQILFLTIPLQTYLMLGVLGLVWLGVTRGLRILEPLIRRLALRESDVMTPITSPDVPAEILPLTHVIDSLLDRLRSTLVVQERFIADAAHQLRTPLAGLRLHIDRALDNSDPAVVRDALEQCSRLTERTARTATQLLALTRAQNPWQARSSAAIVDLARLVPQAVAARVGEALRTGVNLEYRGPDQPAPVQGDAGAIVELLDNLIDNALHYAGAGARATVSLDLLPGADTLLQVEDNGPGVPAEAFDRLGERFFRVAGMRAPGTGLGLAIVKQISWQHRAQLTFGTVAGGGLRIGVHFPAVSPA